MVCSVGKVSCDLCWGVALEKMGDALRAVAWAAFTVLAVMAMGLMTGVIGGAHPVPQPAATSFTQAEFITIILTAVTVVLAALAIMLAIAAVWGYTQIKEVAREAAEKKAIEVAGEKADAVATRVAEATVMKVRRSEPENGDAFAQAEAGEEDGTPS